MTDEAERVARGLTKDISHVSADVTAHECLLMQELGDVEFTPHLSVAARHAGLSIDDAKRSARRLVDRGLARFGPLFDTDDGRPCGSGYWLTDLGLQVRDKLKGIDNG